MAMVVIPEAFARHIAEVWEEEGEAWVQRLPETVAAFERRWSMRVGPPYALSYNYVAPAECADGAAVVFKVGVPRDELVTEIDALRLYDGRASVRLLEADPEAGALLLERLAPGVMLRTIESDEEATRIAAGVMRRLWRPPPAAHSFPTVQDWAAGMVRLRAEFDGGAGPFPESLVAQAESLFRELLDSQAAPVVLHGDLHHDNILAATREPWLAIDPKGVIGEPAFELGAFLANPIGVHDWPDADRLLRRRVELLADELALDRARIRGWGLAHAMLSAWWSYEDEGYGWEGAVALAERFAAMA